MNQSFSRMNRIAEQVQTELGNLLFRKAHDPRFQNVSITAVNVSPDMANANVYVSFLNDAEIKPILKALNKAAGFFRSELAHTLNLKKTPKLFFIYDQSIQKGGQLSSLINESIRKAEKKNDDD